MAQAAYPRSLITLIFKKANNNFPVFYIFIGVVENNIFM